MGFDLMRIALILLIVGGLNCGSIGFLSKDLVSATLGRGTAARVLHAAIGLSAIYIGLRAFGFMEGFENMRANAPAMRNGENMEGFYACKDGKDEHGKPCAA